jgi:hypothetical protein
VPADKLDEETMAFAHRLAQGPPIALRLDKLMIYKGLETDMETAIAFQASCENITLHSEDHTEGVKAFAEKRQPIFRGIEAPNLVPSVTLGKVSIQFSATPSSEKGGQTIVQDKDKRDARH